MIFVTLKEYIINRISKASLYIIKISKFTSNVILVNLCFPVDSIFLVVVKASIMV